jgi:hypothetical protein
MAILLCAVVFRVSTEDAIKFFGVKKASLVAVPSPHPANNQVVANLVRKKGLPNPQSDFSSTLLGSQYCGAIANLAGGVCCTGSAGCLGGLWSRSKSSAIWSESSRFPRQGQPLFLSGASASRHKKSGTQVGIATACRLDHARGSRDVAQERYHQARAPAPVRPEKRHAIRSSDGRISFEQIAIRFRRQILRSPKDDCASIRIREDDARVVPCLLGL